MPSPEGPVEVADDRMGWLGAIAYKALEEYSAASNIEIFKLAASPYCAQLSALTRTRLADQGVATKLRLHTRPTNAHYYLRTCDDEIIVDATWQQFLPLHKQGPERPAILVSRQQSIRRALGALGMSRRRLAIWMDADDVNHAWQHFSDQTLDEIFLGRSSTSINKLK